MGVVTGGAVGRFQRGPARREHRRAVVTGVAVMAHRGDGDVVGRVDRGVVVEDRADVAGPDAERGPVGGVSPSRRGGGTGSSPPVVGVVGVAVGDAVGRRETGAVVDGVSHGAGIVAEDALQLAGGLDSRSAAGEGVPGPVALVFAPGFSGVPVSDLPTKCEEVWTPDWKSCSGVPNILSVRVVIVVAIGAREDGGRVVPRLAAVAPLVPDQRQIPRRRLSSTCSDRSPFRPLPGSGNRSRSRRPRCCGSAPGPGTASANSRSPTYPATRPLRTLRDVAPSRRYPLQPPSLESGNPGAVNGNDCTSHRF